MNVLQYLQQYTLQEVWMTFIQFVDDVYSVLKPTHLEHFSHHVNNPHQNIKFTLVEESNGELAFLDTYNIMERSLYWYIRSLHILTNT